MSGGAAHAAALAEDSASRAHVYEAQHRFVLAQLTAPGVEAFLADDFSDDDEEEGGGAFSRTASKFV